MEARLLAIGGYATSGKDAVANVLVEDLGWYKTYMSKPLEQALVTLNPWIRYAGGSERYSVLHARVGYDESKKNPEVRRLLQTLGTEVGRNMFGQNVWLDAVCREVSDRLASGRNVVVTGIRYPNEIDRFRELNAWTLWVDRPGVEAVNSHSSDNTLTSAWFQDSFLNEGTLNDLRHWVIDMFKE